MKRIVSAAAVVFMMWACGAWAQGAAYPNKPIRVIVPYTAGGSADFMARMVGQRLTEVWNQQVLVENRGGAGGNLGFDVAAKSPADGYTLVVVNNSQAINESLYSHLPFDLRKDFAPVMMWASSPMLLAVHPHVAASNLAEFTRLVKERPGKLSYGSCGVGTPMHLAGELYKFLTHAYVVHVPYRGCSPATLDAIGGQVDAVIATTATALPHVRAGKLKAIALTTAKRTPAAPEIPTFRESGVPELKNYEVDNWYGVMAPAGTPKEIIVRLETEMRKIISSADAKQRMAAVGIDPAPAGPDELMHQLLSDIDKFGKVVRFAGIKGE
ncbi:MAG TPA: tripartite tricarboxylate transporter substrate binding protein [Burkholderiales bacterium]|jgi:tripartite-type tricarboxylate transporter receptor subunit TctC